MADSNVEIALSIINQFKEVSVVEKTTDTVTIEIRNMIFCLWLRSQYDFNRNMPLVTAVDTIESFPHFYKNIKLDGKNHKLICLYESDLLVKSLFSTVEKIEFVLQQLLNLMSLSPSQQELEFQKEFLVYWNEAATSSKKVELFISTSEKHKWLDVYDSTSSTTRLVDPSLSLNDFKNMHHNIKTQALHIPIIDPRGIIPPRNDITWTVSNVIDILNNKQFSKISYDTYRELICYSYSKKTIYLVFEMPANNSTVSFCCEITFKNPGTMKLLDKIQSNTESIKMINTTRCDYDFLNAQIGNDLVLIGKKVAIIGVGSLGSYIACEIIRTGIKDVVLFDSEDVCPENLMRHRGTFQWRNYSKSFAMSIELEWFHPQVNVIPIKKAITAENILPEIVPQNVDLVIFAVGSSDVQLECNSHLKKLHFNKPVLFCWLEGNGKASHVLGIDYSKRGCYQCLFTDGTGKETNNRVNIVPEEELEKNIIRNGCGGTRIAYGNSILLQTANMTLTAIHKVFSNSFEHNFLINYGENSVIEDSDSFYERSCPCCNEN